MKLKSDDSPPVVPGAASWNGVVFMVIEILLSIQ